MNLPRIAFRIGAVLLFVGLLLPAHTLAQSGPASAPLAPTPNWYDVEIIVFANTDPQAGVLESWPADPGVPDWNSAVPLKPAASGLPYMQLPDSGLHLNSVWRKLQRSSDYSPLLRSAWAQPAIDRASALFVRVGTAPAANAPTTAVSVAPPANAPLDIPNSVYGIAKLSTTGPYLHFDLDLVYCGPPAKHVIAATAATAGSPPPSASASPAPVASAPACQPYRLRQDRKLDAGKLNYFDNPMFGALVLITPRAQ